MLISEILKNYGHLLGFSVSKTNRDPREEEVNGRDYDFITTREFTLDIAQNAFVEHEEVYPGRFYGTPWSQLRRIAEEGKTPLGDLDIKGAMRIKQIFGKKAFCVAVVPESQEALVKALVRREGDRDPEGLKARIEKIPQELTFINACLGKFDLCIVNTFDLDDLPFMAKEVMKKLTLPKTV